ncbi:MAG: glycoside hydrolase family 97 N-terminal domain-containing protein, partial [Bacteroidia bacterium]|nr:glycoside hydrolase family 97 N-terminal domain-containing protein [Bacteroidia bacterium]
MKTVFSHLTMLFRQLFILRINLLFLLGLASILSLAASQKGKFYSPENSSYVEWVRANNKTVLKSNIRGVEFLSEIGINLDHKEYLFEGKLKVVQLSPTGKIPLIYRFSAAQSPVKLDIALLDNAVAFRYSSDIGKGLLLMSETSSFSLPEKSKVYYFERKNQWKLMSYAGTWESCDVEKLPQISGTNPVQGLPLILQLPDNRYAVATEVNLQNYSGMRWDAGTPFRIKANFTE